MHAVNGQFKCRHSLYQEELGSLRFRQDPQTNALEQLLPWMLCGCEEESWTLILTGHYGADVTESFWTVLFPVLSLDLVVMSSMIF